MVEETHLGPSSSVMASPLTTGTMGLSSRWSNGTSMFLLHFFHPYWHFRSFLGGDMFCIKVCDPAGAHAADFCQHIYGMILPRPVAWQILNLKLDRIGCAYNAPAAYQDGVFEKCKGDNQDFPGVYTGADGQGTPPWLILLKGHESSNSVYIYSTSRVPRPHNNTPLYPEDPGLLRLRDVCFSWPLCSCSGCCSEPQQAQHD